jgi:hypothetical protein
MERFWFEIVASSLSKLDRMDEARAFFKQIYQRQSDVRTSRMFEASRYTRGMKFAVALPKAGVQK